MAWTAPRTWTIGELVTKTILDTHVRDNFLFLHGDAGVIALVDGATFTKSQNSQLKVSVDNVNTGTGTYSEVSARNAASDGDAARLLCFGTSWTTTGGYLQDGAAVVADVNLSGGLSIATRHASGIMRFYTAGSADANERMRITSAGLVGIGTSSIDERLHVANSAGASAVKIENEGGAAGDASVIFALSGTSKWAIGMDDSNNDSFSISASGVLGTTEMANFISGTSINLTIDANNYFVMAGYCRTYTSYEEIGWIVDSDNNSTSAGFVWGHNGNGSYTALMYLFDEGMIGLGGDFTNANMTMGITLDQGSNDNEIFAVKSSDVAHGMTTIAETDTYGLLQKSSITNGGLLIRGFTAATAGVHIQGYYTTDNTSKTTAAVGGVTIDAFKANGTGTQSPGANAALVVFRDGSAATAQFIFDVEGDSHENGTGWTAYDEHDDVALLDALDHSLDKRLRAETGAWLSENEAALEAAGIVHFNRDTDGVPFVNRSRLGMLLVGAVRQLGREVAALKGGRS